MTVLAYDPYVEPEEIARRGARSVTFDEMLAQSDIVSIHCPRTGETMGMMDARALARMKKGALFVTTARGGIHDETALFEALNPGRSAGAGLDVWEKEPPPLHHPLLKLDSVIASYHTAGVTVNAPGGCRRRRRANRRPAQGRPPAALVNPEVWPAYPARFEAILGVPVSSGRHRAVSVHTLASQPDATSARSLPLAGHNRHQRFTRGRGAADHELYRCNGRGE